MELQPDKDRNRSGITTCQRQEQKWDYILSKTGAREVGLQSVKDSNRSGITTCQGQEEKWYYNLTIDRNISGITT